MKKLFAVRRRLAPLKMFAGLALVLFVFALGWRLGSAGAPIDGVPNVSVPIQVPEPTLWTCSMHPQIRQDRPGKCPICAMDLIPVDQGDGAARDPVFHTTPGAAALMDLQVTPVTRRFPDAELRLVGKVALDETSVGRITAWVPGRLDRLYVDYTGITVRKGDHLVELYSPALITAQEELRRAASALAALREGAPDALRRASEATMAAAREKLRRWGLTEGQVKAAERDGTLSDHLTIYAPSGGTVMEMQGREGMYVETGSMIYTIADLSKVWVMLEAYERDLPWLHYGQAVTFSAEAYPGESFEGRIAFIDPIVDPVTRTVRVRVNAANSDGRLKPGMFVRGVVRARLATGGRVMDASLAGKWISPMHPEIVKDGPGQCDVCGMDLVPAESLGYVPAATEGHFAPLVIPATAPLVTGKRAVVYVRQPGTEAPTFEGREIELGPRAGDVYLVASGLAEGEEVVTRGAFKIDSAMAIQAKPGMMQMTPGTSLDRASHAEPPSPREDAHVAKQDVPEAFREALRGVVDDYMPLQLALAEEDLDRARESIAALRAAVDGVPDETHWREHVLPNLRETLNTLDRADGLEAARTAFEPLSGALMDAVRAFGLSDGLPIYRVHCPMAFDFAGADWMQTDETIRNPYFGSEMFSCGTVKEQIIEDLR